MIKVILTQNNDILYNSLSEISLNYERKIELINVLPDKLAKTICQLKTKENVIILDANTSVTFCKNILKNAIEIGRANIIILVIDSSNISSIINHEKHHSFFQRKPSKNSIMNIIDLITKSLNDTLEIEKNIDSILWKIGLTSYFRGTTYIKDAIFFAYVDKKILYDTRTLVKKVAEKNNISNDALVRSDMDKALNNVLDLVDQQIIYDIFGSDYDGRKISLRYFIDLCIRYLNNKKDIAV